MSKTNPIFFLSMVVYKMTRNVMVFIPKDFSSFKSGYIKGFCENNDVYYITNPKVFPYFQEHIGYCGKFHSQEFFGKNKIYVEQNTNNIKVNTGSDEPIHIIQVNYDFHNFTNGACMSNSEIRYGKYVEHLIEKLKKDNYSSGNGNKNIVLLWLIFLLNNISKTFSKLKPLLKSCSTLVHLKSDLQICKWILTVLQEEKRISKKIGNKITAKCIDLVFGILLFYFCLEHKCLIISHWNVLSQEFVTNLRELLIYLMGSPIGLKLNYAFNHSLGTFFFYHINLWRVFLQTMQPIIENNFELILMPSLFGMSYLIAILCDMISIATFHIYCIYVYAARLFSLQTKGLVALWRLFIGRKSNPLRNRIDSCEYSSNQLFIGTLGFTILLFLLPTTTMYYTVFAGFRLITLFIHILLNKFRDVLSNVPLYIMILWIFKSGSIAGSLNIVWKEEKDNTNIIEVRLTPLPLNQCIKKYGKYFETNSHKDTSNFASLASSILTGHLI